MRLLVCTAVAAIAVSGAALAQTPPAPASAALSANCTTLSAPPAVPDGATTPRREMERAIEGYRAWQTGYTAQVERCRADIKALEDLAAANARAFTEAQQPFVAASQAWVAEVDEFNARAPRRDSRATRGQ